MKNVFLLYILLGLLLFPSSCGQYSHLDVCILLLQNSQKKYRNYSNCLLLFAVPHSIATNIVFPLIPSLLSIKPKMKDIYLVGASMTLSGSGLELDILFALTIDFFLLNS